MMRRRCPECKKVKEMQSGQETCSKRCAGRRLARKQSAEFKKRRLELALAAARKSRREKEYAKYQQLIDKYGPIEAVKKAYQMGYHAGHRARRYYEVGEGMRRKVGIEINVQEGFRRVYDAGGGSYEAHQIVR